MMVRKGFLREVTFKQRLKKSVMQIAHLSGAEDTIIGLGYNHCKIAEARNTLPGLQSRKEVHGT